MDASRKSLLADFRNGASKKAVDEQAWAPMLEFELPKGKRFAIRNGNLLWMHFAPQAGIVMRFSTHTIRITGHELEPLYQELLTMKCKRVVEVDKRYLMGDEPGPVVTEVRVKRKPGGQAAGSAGTSRNGGAE